MGIFNLFKKKPSKTEPANTFLLAMPMFKNDSKYQIDKVISELQTKWHFDVTEFEGDGETASFKLDGVDVVLAFMPFPIPADDIEGTAHYAYNWPSAIDELKDCTGHAIVTVVKEQQTFVEGYKMLSKVLGAILATGDAIGIYDGGQSLLIPKQQYLDSIECLEEDDIPINLWVYIGLRTTATGNCAYTYGLKTFQKKEIEIIDSKQTIENLFELLFNISTYILTNDVMLKDGETVGLTAEQKIPISTSQGVFVDGISLKLNV